MIAATLTDVALLVIAFILWKLLKAVQESLVVLRSLTSHTAQLSRIAAGQETQAGAKSHTPPVRGSIDSGENEAVAAPGASLTRSPVSQCELMEDEDGCSMLKSSRPLRLSAKQFEDCLLGDHDVDVKLFMHGCLQYTHILQRMGPFSSVMIREVENNVKKINSAYQVDHFLSRSMNELLGSEADAAMHSRGGVLADPSAAMGLLWARRGLLFWEAVYRLALQNIKDNSKEIDIRRVAEKAHWEVLAGCTGWVSQSSFKLVTSTMPDWATISAVLAPDSAMLRQDLERWSRAIVVLGDRMRKMHTDKDLEDTRRSL
mmetsp:Transcript_12393/g.34808  ORF Transcript_12393/g.34808 Transcript_12393/m.34808 type:complete len:316 (+) Transcript_12393:139-1086(+)|eukprot:CAMPEP_0117687702 /NCGR_PEP_ID=MMETSP0804-20121206/23307_1 /TAXON_ID=1074897 /ORGANISM="Tetraselmis astigmatica, Strain CCMP880" /LENGTH=315 /DNA_ID=CAMNT_0005499845 /DNA_START=90 /DNA_END=1037 /DNA_ORIENTATION=+